MSAEARPAQAPQPLLYQHSDGRQLVTLPGSPLIAGDPSWYRAGPVEVDPALTLTALALQPGEWYAGAVLNADGTAQHHVIVAASARGLNFDQAQAWTAERELYAPTRQESRLIVAHHAGRLDDLLWFWTCEEHDSAYAWNCYLNFGYVVCNVRGAAGGAVAVRRLVLRSFGA